MLQSLYHCEKILARSHSNYLAQTSVELTQLSNKANDAISRLTVIATIIVPMNIITGKKSDIVYMIVYTHSRYID